MDKFIAKDKNYAKTHEEVYAQDSIIKDYFENHGWSIKQNDFRNYYVYNTNMFLYPKTKACDMEDIKVEHIDLDKITSRQNPYCINVDEKIEVTIKKSTNDALVDLN